MSAVLKLKHWQLFFWIILGVFLLRFTVEGNIVLTSILRVAGVLIFFSWPLLMGHALYQRVPENIKLPYTLFVINCAIAIVAYAAIAVFLGNEEYKVEGLLALPFLYFIFAVVYSFAFPVKVLKTIELGEEARFERYVLDIFLVALLPIGIWFLQPRINRVAKEISE